MVPAEYQEQPITITVHTSQLIEIRQTAACHHHERHLRGFASQHRVEMWPPSN
jgi:hypothetical protein